MKRRIFLRPGYTFIELLAVMAILGILVALLLPALQSAREAARRSTCSRHLTQIVLALHSYEASFRVCPSGTVDQQGPIQSLPTGYHHSWITQILPYLEQSNTYRHIDRRLGVYHTAHRPVRRLNFPVLRCPSSSSALATGVSDYAGVHHDQEAPIDVENLGVFFLNSAVRYRDLTEGSSQTLFIGEKRTLADDLGWMSGTRATLRNTGMPINVPLVVPWARQAPYDLRSSDNRSPLDKQAILDGLFGPSGQKNIWRQAGASSQPLPPFVRPKDPRLAVGGFGSMHPGGAQFVRGDGGLMFLTENVDPFVYRDLANRSDREMRELPY